MGTSISVIGDSNAIAKLGSYYVDSRNIFSVTNKEGEFEPRVANWSVNLQSSKIHPVIGLKMLFSEPVEEEFYSRVAVVTTGFETLFQQGSDEFGFITRISKICDENGEEGVRVLMTNRLGKEYSFTVPADRMYFDVNGKKETFKENAFLHFMQPKNGANIPMVMDFLDLDADNWEGMGGNYVTKLEHYGTFERIRNNEIYCRLNGESKGMYMRPNTNVTGYRYDNEKGRYDTVPLTDLVGQDVWCITVNSYIVAVICQR